RCVGWGIVLCFSCYERGCGCYFEHSEIDLLSSHTTPSWHLTAPGRRGCNRRASWPPSLSLGRWAALPPTIMNAIKTPLALVACRLALGSHASEITGRVTLKGTPPAERTVDLKSDAALAAKHPKGLTTRHYQVSPD